MIRIIKSDITKLKLDCIVNAANKSLLGGGGVDGAIHYAAGPKLLEECRKLDGCKSGEAKITNGYNLPAKYVIHTVGPIYGSTPNEKQVLKNCYINSLNIAKSKNLKSIAFPSISTGVYGYPKKEAAEIAISSIKEWKMKNNYDINVIICCFDNLTEEIYLDLLKNV